MDPDAKRFIDLAVARIKGTAELRLSGEAELARLLEARTDKSPGALAEAVDSFTRADLKPVRHWKWGLCASALLVSLPLLSATLLQFGRLFHINPSSPYALELAIEAVPTLPEEIGAASFDSLLLFGNQSFTAEGERWKALWESNPADPAYFADYVLGYASDHRVLSEDLLETAGQLDPENAWFGLLAARGAGEKAIGRQRTVNTPAHLPKPTPVWDIRDEQELHTALSMIRSALQKPRLETYRREMLARRLRAIPPPSDLPGRVLLSAYVESQPSGNSYLRKIAELFAAGAQECARTGDREEFLRIMADWKALSRRVLQSDGDVSDSLRARTLFTLPLPNLRDAAKDLQLEPEHHYLQTLCEQEQRSRGLRSRDTPGYGLVRQHGSDLAKATIRRLADSPVPFPPICPENLRAGREAEHAVFERLYSWIGWLLVGICAGVAALGRNRQPKLALQLSQRLQDLFSPSDWIGLVAGGVLLPLAWYFFITRLTPASAREWSVGPSSLPVSIGQFGSLVLAMITLPVAIASRRLEKRGAVLGLRPGFRWPADLAAACSLLAVPAYAGILLPGTSGETFEKAAYGLSVVAGLWIFLSLVICFIARADQTLRRATLGHLLWPVWVSGMLFLALLSPVFQAEESRSVGADQFSRLSPESPPTRYEHDAASLIRSNALEIMDEPENLR